MTMMSILQSFKGRFVVVAVLLALVMLGMAIYTSKMVHDDTRVSTALISEYNSASDSLKALNDQYLRLKSLLYQYTLLLTPEQKTATLNTVTALKDLSARLRMSRIKDLSPDIKSYTEQHDIILAKLSDDIDKILDMQRDAQTRYPAVAIMLNELQPLNRYFSEQLEAARDEVSDIGDKNSERIVAMLDKVRYAWTRRISEVRLFTANRSGTFGDLETVLPNNIQSVHVYGDRVDELLDEIRDISYQVDRAIIFKRAVDEMILASSKYTHVFSRTVDAFMDEAWRADVYFLEHTIEPRLAQSLAVLESIENILSSKLGQRVQLSLQTATTVSSYIWWFVIIVYILIMLAYLAFEKTIRQPLFEVARALDAHGRNDEYEIPLRHYFSAESELLIAAFNSMKEQVDSRQLRLQSILQNTVEGIVITNAHGVIETFNPAAEILFSRPVQEVSGKSVSILRDDACDISEEEWMSLWTKQPGNGQEITEVRMCNDTEERYLSIKTSRMIHRSKIYYISLVSDITDHKALTNRLQNLADMDSLTGLHNRRYFTEELERLINRSSRKDASDSALLFIDLDNFKLVNDTYGHNAGDSVLIEVSSILKGIVRKGDLLARLGGDEFAVILYGINEKLAIDVACKYQSMIADFTFYEQGKVMDVGCTIGVSMLDDSVKSKDDFITRADFACQMAKQMGRNRVHVYSQDDSRDKEQMRGQMGMAQTIKEAIRHDGFRLVLQPIKTADANSTFCYEVLIRMLGENQQLVMPFGFLPSAERFNLMKDIDIWVIRNAIHLLSEYLRAGQHIRFSINLSAQSIGDFSIIQKTEEALEEYNVSPANLVFEITESNAISHMKKATQFLQYLRDLGCKTALDDFGAGYSSYAYLKDLPADFVKIDGAFVKNMDHNDLNLAMVKSMNEIAHIMGKQTIAEFVDNAAVLSLLQEIGVDYVQGYYLGKPTEQIPDQCQGSVIPLR
jgi:diguanylate cyclase (GGDEF)-like protein/PAS domain S-box-containing protein